MKFPYFVWAVSLSPVALRAKASVGIFCLPLANVRSQLHNKWAVLPSLLMRKTSVPRCGMSDSVRYGCSMIL
jgi:hypothetical protein